jgi:hypothetical protein
MEEITIIHTYDTGVAKGFTFTFTFQFDFDDYE